MKILHTLFLPLLILLSWLYGLTIWIRNGLFNVGLFTSISFDIPIISVGNITMGGAGKTPMVIFLAKLLERSGYKPGIVSRGYRRNSKGLVIVHDGKSLLTDVNNAGDEPYLMGKELNTIPVIVSKNRIAGIRELLNNFSVEIVILDDAFQHRKAGRIMDVVMISAYDKLIDYHLIPWGKLREPLRNLNRAQCIIYTNTKQFQNPPQHNNLNAYYTNPPIASIMQPTLMKIDNTGYHKSLPVNEPVFVFCGISNPNSFIQTVKDVGLKIVGVKKFGDHKKYSAKTIQELSALIKSNKCRVVVTTEKDIVKMPDNFIKEFLFFVIKIDVVFENDSEIIDLIGPVFSPLSSHR